MNIGVALEGGVPLDAIAPLLGHPTTVMTKTYAHWSAIALRVATGKAAAQLAQLPGPTVDATPVQS
jgi:hypothetical protein